MFYDVLGTNKKGILWLNNGFMLANICCQLDTNGNRKSQFKTCLSHINLWACLWGIFLITNCCRRTQMGMGIPSLCSGLTPPNKVGERKLEA